MSTDGGSPTSKDGENIIATLSQARKFLGEVAKLLRTADAAMEDASWSAKVNQAVTVSKSLNDADEWLPYFAFRFYENEDQKHLLPFIAVLFDYYDEDMKVKMLEEPLLTAGWHDYSTGGKIEDHSFYCAVIHVYIREWEADGKGHPSNPRTIFSKWSNMRTAAERCRSFALPLMSFASADDLTQRVVDPLLEDIKSFSGKAK
jgi:hypothetical protein